MPKFLGSFSFRLVDSIAFYITDAFESDPRFAFRSYRRSTVMYYCSSFIQFLCHQNCLLTHCILRDFPIHVHINACPLFVL